MEKRMRIALAQINSVVGDLEGNVNKIVHFVKKAQKFKADIVTFPELAICGYPPEDLLLKEHFVKDNLKALNSLVRKISNIAVIVGFVDRDKKGYLYNAAAVISKGKIKGIYHKVKLPNYGVFDEKRYFQPGKEFPLFELNQVVFGINICEDIWELKGVAKLQADEGAQVIINISASPYYAGKENLKKKILTKQAKETRTYLCYNNLVGGQDELVFDGGSVVFDFAGKEIIRGKQFEEDLIIADLPIKKITNKIRGKKCIKISIPENIKKPVLPESKVKKSKQINKIYSALVLGTQDYIRKNGFQKVVVGLSGGIDSALTAVIARDAIGKENVIGISMPSRYSLMETQKDARILAKNLGIRFITISIEDIFKVYLRVLEKEFLGLKNDVTEENLQARIRGNILMAFSNKFNWLVLTTGNKSETSVGYCTLYGDMAGGFAVIKDVPKIMVYRLAEFVNEKENESLIPESILVREPSAELRENQKDRDSLPPYTILDKIIKGYVEEDKSSKKITTNKISIGTVRKIIRMVDKNEYKRRQSSPGIKITSKAFGKDRRFPITNKYKE
ncbi:NAD+ synthase [bacterium]|nr:NAD+ synthase [bacterium]